VFLLLLLPALVQAQTRSWSTVWDSGAFDVPGCSTCSSHSYLPFNRALVRSKHAAAVDASGNVFLAGTSWNGADYDAVVVKLGPGGNRLWTGVYDGGDEDVAYAVAVDAAGNVYLTGHSVVMTGDFDLQPHLLIAKLNAAGALQWARTNGAGGIWSEGFSLVLDSAGNGYFAGEVYTGDFISALLGSFSPSGDFRWLSRPYLGFEYEESSATDVALDTSGNVYATGYIYKPLSTDYTDYFIASRTSTGGFRWQKAWDGGGGDQAYAVTTDEAGGVFATGSSGTVAYSNTGVFGWAAPFSGVANAVVASAGAVFVTGSSAAGDVRTVRYDAANGAAQWNRTWDGGGSDSAYALALAGGRLWAAGAANGDALVLAYDPATGTAWADRYDNGRSESAFALAAAPDGGVAVAGATGDDFLALRYSVPAAAVALQSLALSPAAFPGGCKTSTGKVTLSAPAPAGGAVVALANTNPVAAVPVSVTVPAGKTSAMFTISAPAVAAVQTGSVTASYGGASVSQTLKVRPVGVLSVTLSPGSVAGPGSVDGSVLLECAASVAPIDVKLSSGNSTVAWPNVSGFTIPAGSATGRFTVSAADVSTTTSVGIKATASGIGKTAVLTVLP
jgi:hypothetical protein